MADLKYNALQSHSGPVLAGFSASPLPQHFITGEDELKFKLFTHKDAPRQKILLAENDRFAFKGTNFGKSSSKHQNSRFFVGLWDKEAQELRFTDVDGCFTMEQTLKGANLTANEFSGQTDEQQRNELVKNFGTKKSQNRLRATMGKQLEDKEVEAGLVESVKDKVRELKEHLPEAKSVEDFLPPHNIDATEAADLYPLSGLIPAEVMDSLDLKFVQKALKKRKVFKVLKESWEDFPLGLLEKASEFEIERLKVLVYLNCLLRASNLNRVLKVDKDEQWTVLVSNTTQNEFLLKHLLKTFFMEKAEKTGTKYIRNKVLTDKLITHIVILAFIANNFALSPEKIAQAMKMPVNKVTTYMKCVGAKRPGSGEYVLKPPLQFPASKLPRRRR